MLFIYAQDPSVRQDGADVDRNLQRDLPDGPVQQVVQVDGSHIIISLLPEQAAAEVVLPEKGVPLIVRPAGGLLQLVVQQDQVFCDSLAVYKALQLLRIRQMMYFIPMRNAPHAQQLPGFAVDLKDLRASHNAAVDTGGKERDDAIFGAVDMLEALLSVHLRFKAPALSPIPPQADNPAAAPAAGPAASAYLLRENARIQQCHIALARLPDCPVRDPRRRFRLPMLPGPAVVDKDAVPMLFKIDIRIGYQISGSRNIKKDVVHIV